MCWSCRVDCRIMGGAKGRGGRGKAAHEGGCFGAKKKPLTEVELKRSRGSFPPVYLGPRYRGPAVRSAITHKVLFYLMEISISQYLFTSRSRRSRGRKDLLRDFHRLRQTPRRCKRGPEENGSKSPFYDWMAVQSWRKMTPFSPTAKGGNAPGTAQGPGARVAHPKRWGNGLRRPRAHRSPIGRKDELPGGLLDGPEGVVHGSGSLVPAKDLGLQPRTEARISLWSPRRGRLAPRGSPLTRFPGDCVGSPPRRGSRGLLIVRFEYSFPLPAALPRPSARVRGGREERQPCSRTQNALPGGGARLAQV